MNPFQLTSIEANAKLASGNALTGEQYIAKIEAEVAEDRRIRNSVKTATRGHRPKCINCGRELRLYRYRGPNRPGKLYGTYGDNRFCGLTCGYQHALHVTRK